jgi:superfamily II DNA or RNA helicase
MVYEHKHPMEIKYDNGTLTLKLPAEWRRNKTLFGLLTHSTHWKWDSRIGTYRAPAHQFTTLLEEFKSLRLQCVQNITSNFSDFKLISSNLELRDYQEEAFQQWMKRGQRGVVVLPTGAGKTRLALHTIKMIQRNTLILVPTRVLLYQWIEEIQN